MEEQQTNRRARPCNLSLQHCLGLLRTRRCLLTASPPPWSWRCTKRCHQAAAPDVEAIGQMSYHHRLQSMAPWTSTPCEIQLLYGVRDGVILQAIYAAHHFCQRASTHLQYEQRPAPKRLLDVAALLLSSQVARHRFIKCGLSHATSLLCCLCAA